LGATFNATFALPDGSNEVVRFGSMPTELPPLRLQALSVRTTDIEISGGLYDTNDPWYPVLRFELRSVYRLSHVLQPDAQVESVRILDPLGKDHLSGDDPSMTFTRMLGVDRVRDDGMPGFDGLVDERFLERRLGAVILPDLRPFDPTEIDAVWPPFFYDQVRPPAGTPFRPALRVPNDAVYNKPVSTDRFDSLYEIVSVVDFSPGVDLAQPVFPNPFVDQVSIPLQLGGGSTAIRAEIFAVDGRRVRLLADRQFQENLTALIWDGNNDASVRQAAGIYFLQLDVNGQRQVRKLVLHR
jgi:hypothetical protein